VETAISAPALDLVPRVVDLNLGIQTFLNGAPVSNIVLDTTQAATDTIDYVVTDQNGMSFATPVSRYVRYRTLASDVGSAA
jgi:hypothetical protein